MMVPEGIFPIIIFSRYTEFRQRFGIVHRLQIVGDAAADYTVNKSQYLGRFDPTVCHQVQVIKHDDICKYQEFAGSPGLVDRLAGQVGDLMLFENMKPVLRNRG